MLHRRDGGRYNRTGRWPRRHRLAVKVAPRVSRSSGGCSVSPNQRV